MAVLEQFQSLSEERFLALYLALSERGFGPLDHEVAKLLRFRPQAIKKIPIEKRAKLARNWIEQKRNAELCYELLGQYLMRSHLALVTGFLDATGVPHEEGMISDVDKARPDPARIGAAVKELDAKFPPEDVTLYLALCTEHWPDMPELAALWRDRSGVKA